MKINFNMHKSIFFSFAFLAFIIMSWSTVASLPATGDLDSVGNGGNSVLHALFKRSPQIGISQSQACNSCNRCSSRRCRSNGSCC
ncbi:hypothetical protein Ocin01_00532 [Orchesella cincta]|uniref:Uncharacterized protein n=1 Tax=Orchesella cincta TaxID=48709 RepID=A0A1D2NLH1_ORCCI|nr:hypothetical protein Ocin01_00532 [Orchesella cincta]